MTVGIVVDPRIRILEVYRPMQENASEVLRDGDILKVPELLPGWEMEISSIWAPEFD
jgi:Uma2 family endonuclease